MSAQADGRKESLKLNLLILLGMHDAVSRDRALEVSQVLATASDASSTDGVQYSPDEVHAALNDLIAEELIRLVKGEFDGSQVVDYATSIHPDHTLYITPAGILHVKRLIDRP